MYEIIKNDSHCLLICCTRILQAKWHDCVIKIPFQSTKCGIHRIMLFILIWLYPEDPSMKDIAPYPVVALTTILVIGIGKSSFGQARFKSRKSTHNRTCPFFFIMGTILASHRGYYTSLIKPALIIFSTSTMMSSCNSGRKRCGACFTGRNLGSIASLCVAT
jgi:hypothetical protein